MEAREMKHNKPYTCELCGKTDKTVELFIGGPFTYLHQKCADIGDKAITAHMERLVCMNQGLYYLANEIIRAHDEIHSSKESAKK